MSRSCPLPPAGAVNSHLSTVNSQLVIGKNDGNLLQFADLISHENDEIFFDSQISSHERTIKEASCVTTLSQPLAGAS